MNYVLVLTAVGLTLVLTPIRWLFLGAVLGKFTPGDALYRKIRSVSIAFARRYINTPEVDATSPHD